MAFKSLHPCLKQEVQRANRIAVKKILKLMDRKVHKRYQLLSGLDTGGVSDAEEVCVHACGGERERDLAVCILKGSNSVRLLSGASTVGVFTPETSLLHHTHTHSGCIPVQCTIKHLMDMNK